MTTECTRWVLDLWERPTNGARKPVFHSRANAVVKREHAPVIAEAASLLAARFALKHPECAWDSVPRPVRDSIFDAVYDSFFKGEGKYGTSPLVKSQSSVPTAIFGVAELWILELINSPAKGPHGRKSLSEPELIDALLALVALQPDQSTRDELNTYLLQLKQHHALATRLPARSSGDSGVDRAAAVPSTVYPHAIHVGQRGEGKAGQYALVEIPGDGDCLISAIAAGTNRPVAELRTAIFQTIAAGTNVSDDLDASDGPNFNESLKELGLTLDQYQDRWLKGRMQGGMMELSAASLYFSGRYAFRVSIVDDNSLFNKPFYVKDPAAGIPTIALVWKRSVSGAEHLNHFDVIGQVAEDPLKPILAHADTASLFAAIPHIVKIQHRERALKASAYRHPVGPPGASSKSAALRTGVSASSSGAAASAPSARGHGAGKKAPAGRAAGQFAVVLKPPQKTTFEALVATIKGVGLHTFGESILRTTTMDNLNFWHVVFFKTEAALDELLGHGQQIYNRTGVKIREWLFGEELAAFKAKARLARKGDGFSVANSAASDNVPSRAAKPKKTTYADKAKTGPPQQQPNRLQQGAVNGGAGGARKSDPKSDSQRMRPPAPAAVADSTGKDVSLIAMASMAKAINDIQATLRSLVPKAGPESPVSEEAAEDGATDSPPAPAKSQSGGIQVTVAKGVATLPMAQLMELLQSNQVSPAQPRAVTILHSAAKKKKMVFEPANGGGPRPDAGSMNQF
jgi:hypothetical protein